MNDTRTVDLKMTVKLRPISKTAARDLGLDDEERLCAAEHYAYDRTELADHLRNAIDLDFLNEEAEVKISSFSLSKMPPHHTNREAYDLARAALFKAWLDDEDYSQIEASEDAIASIDEALKKAFKVRK